MNCTKCGNKIQDGAKFCNVCGERINVENHQNNEDQNNQPNVNLNKDEANVKEGKVAPPPAKKNKTLKVVIGVIVVLIAAIGIASLAGESEEVSCVKNGYFEAYPSESGYPSIGEAFDDYFSDPSWESFTSEEGMEIVQFDGGFTYYDDDTDCSLQFQVYDDGSFEIYAVEFNGVPQNKLVIAALVERVMEHSIGVGVREG